MEFLDLVYVPGWISHVEHAWEEPGYARFLARLATFARVITFDKRGTGLSDHDAGLPTLEQRMEDIRTVMDAVGSERAAIFGVSEGGNMSALFAATYPERTVAVVTFGIFAKRIWSPDYPWAPTPDERQKDYDVVERDWDGEMDVSRYAPSADAARRSPHVAHLLPPQREPRRGAGAAAHEHPDRHPRGLARGARAGAHPPPHGRSRRRVEEARWIAAAHPRGPLRRVAGGRSHAVDRRLRRAGRRGRGVPHRRARGSDPDRVLATVLFTDIVDATATAASSAIGRGATCRRTTA